MALSRPLLVVAGLAALGLAVVGVGAGASFTTSTASTQTITAGTIGMSVYADGASCDAAAQGCSTISLPPVGPVGSTFETPATHVKVTNTGNIPATFASIQMSEADNGTSASVSLRNELSVCIHSTDPSGTWVEGNGPLNVATGLNPTVVENPVVVQPGQTVTYWVSFYAGQNSSCGSIYSDGSNTTAAWTAAAGGAYQTPASLTNAAMGGSVTPTLTFAFTG